MIKREHYQRGYGTSSGWDGEIMCDFNVTSIPKNSMINSDILNFTVQSLHGGYNHTVQVYKNTRDWK